MDNLELDVFKAFDQQWALVSAGTAQDFNAMTISWGGLGTLWGKPAATVYIRPERYTHDYMDKNDYFTVSFFPEEYRDDLTLLGTKSGRDGDKIAETKLTPVEVENGMGYKEAVVTLVCKKVYRQDMLRELMPKEISESFYADAIPHTIFIGEVEKIIR